MRKESQIKRLLKSGWKRSVQMSQPFNIALNCVVNRPEPHPFGDGQSKNLTNK